MTDSKNNVRRSIGPRRTGEGEAAPGADPLAELTRFMDGQSDNAAFAPRRAAPARRHETDADETGDMPVRRPIRRQPQIEPTHAFDAPATDDREADGSAADEADAPVTPEQGDPDQYAAGDDDQVSGIDEGVREDDAEFHEATGEGDDFAGLDEADADDGDPDDPFMQALMEELDSDGAPQTEAAPPPRTRPSFSFPPLRPSADAAAAAASPAGAASRGSDAPASDAGQAGPSSPPTAGRAPTAPAPTVRSRATPVAPPPVQANIPVPPARADTERLEHARDHAAITSEADGALDQLRSKLARGHHPGTAEAAAGATKPSAPRPATSWGRPAQQPEPVPASEPIERPSFVREAPVAAPIAAPSGQGIESAEPVEPEDAHQTADDRFEMDAPHDGEIEEHGTVELGFNDIEDDAGPDIDHDLERADAATDDAGWALDEDELANAIALSVGGADQDDEYGESHADIDAEPESDDLYAVDADGDLSHDGDIFAHEEDDAGHQGAEIGDLDHIDFEFELLTTAPDATADDFRKPSERAEPGDLPEQLEIAPFDADASESHPEMGAFARSSEAPADADDEGADEAASVDADDADVADDPIAEADDGDDDPDSDLDAEDEAVEDAVPARVFPELASRARRAVPSFRFDPKDTGHPAQAEAGVPAKPRDRDLDFDLPGLGASDPWSAWPAGPTQAAKTGAAATMTDSGSTVADQLADALFDEKPKADQPRLAGNRQALAGADWQSQSETADQDEAGYETEAYEDDAPYGDDEEAYYDEAEPEWDEHGLPPHSLGEMDAALGLSDRPRRKMGRPVAAGILLLLLAGGGYAAYNFMGGSEEVADGPPPVIQADADGVKVMADGADQTDGGKAVYDRLGEESSESGRLVRSQEVPIDPSQSAAVDSPISSPLLPKRVRTVVVRPDGTIIPADELDAAQGETGALVAPTTPESVSGDAASDVATSPTPIADVAPETVAEASQAEPTAASETAEALLPDVSGDAETDTAADTPRTATDPTSTAPDAEPEAAALSPIRTSERIAAEPSPAPVPRPAASEGTRTVSTSRVTTPAASQQSGPLSLVPDAPGAATSTPPTTTTTLPSPSRPAPQETVGDRVSPAVLAAQNQRATQPQSTQTATATPAATPAPAATAPSGAWAVQVSSQRSADQARAAYQQLQRRFPGVLGGREPAIQSADLGDRGTFYRVRLPTQTRDAANQLCAELKSAGGDCFVGRN